MPVEPLVRQDDRVGRGLGRSLGRYELLDRIGALREQRVVLPASVPGNRIGAVSDAQQERLDPRPAAGVDADRHGRGHEGRAADRVRIAVVVLARVEPCVLDAEVRRDRRGLDRRRGGRGNGGALDRRGPPGPRQARCPRPGSSSREPRRACVCGEQASGSDPPSSGRGASGCVEDTGRRNAARVTKSADGSRPAG